MSPVVITTEDWEILDDVFALMHVLVDGNVRLELDKRDRRFVVKVGPGNPVEAEGASCYQALTRLRDALEKKAVKQARKT